MCFSYRENKYEECKKEIHVPVVRFCVFLVSFSPTDFHQAKGVCKVQAERELFKNKIQHVLSLQILFLLPEVQGKGAELTLQIIRKKG